MARRRTPSADVALADLVCNRWQTADDARAPRVVKWDESYRDHDPAYIDRQAVTRPPYIKYPYLDRVRVLQTSMISDATEAGGRWMWAQHLSADDDSRRRSESATEYLEWVYHRPAEAVHKTNRMACDRVGQMGLTYGEAYFHVRWKRGYVCWESVSPYDVWPDPRHGEWFIVLRTVTLARLLDIAKGISDPSTEEGFDVQTGERVSIELPPRDGGRAMRTFKAVEKAIRSGLTQDQWAVRTSSSTDMDRRYDTGRVSGDPVHDMDRYVAPEDDPFNAEITILECHETHPDGMISAVIPGFQGGENLVLQSERNPYKACTLVRFMPRFIDNEQFGIGNGESAGGPAKALDYNFRASLAVIAAHGWPALLNTRRSNLRKNFMGSIYGLTIDVDNIATDLGFLNPPAIGAGYHQIGMQIAQMGADMGTGEGAKDPNKVAGAGSATQGAILESYASKADRAILRQWAATMEQLAHVTMAVSGIHITETQLIPVLGRKTPGFVEMRPEMFEGPWYFRFGGSTRNATQALASHLNIAQTYSQLGDLDTRESLREAYRLAGERDPERFLLRKDEPIPVEPSREHLMILDGQMPVVSPREELLKHWQEHMLTLQNWMRSMPPGDPRLSRLQTHLIATQMALQAQMMQMGGGQPGSAGGVQPLAPQEVGTQGQPATMQPMTAGINEQRQASNGAAAGQAPGPTGSVPGRAVGNLVQGGPRRGAQ